MRARLAPSRCCGGIRFGIAAGITNYSCRRQPGYAPLLREAEPTALAVLALHADRAVAVYSCFAVLSQRPQRAGRSGMMVFGASKALSMAVLGPARDATTATGWWRSCLASPW
jgi:hypothetical protein